MEEALTTTAAVPTARWYAEDTTPAEIEAALRELLEQQHTHDAAPTPARVLNLIAVVDRPWRGEIVNRLERVGRYHPSRTVVVAVQPGKRTLDAWATLGASDMGDGLMVIQEQVEIELGERQLPGLAAIVDPLILSDLTTLVWSPHGHEDAVDALSGLADVVLFDSLDVQDMREAVKRACRLSEDCYVVDLAWLRSTPWRERVAATFDPPRWRPALREITHVAVRHRPDSAVSGLLFLGWLSSRLGWTAGALTSAGGRLSGRSRAGKQEVRVELQPVPMDAPGLAGVTIETASGDSLSLDRGPGGLAAKRRTRDGLESSYVVLGASRGEPGILGEGIRQALLRDPTYRPAVACAQRMLG
ncbi:MAG TPA: glucose-6-phosphate dehydrogenase assembly protein OpcA [Thermoleophilaceae bacterium]